MKSIHQLWGWLWDVWLSCTGSPKSLQHWTLQCCTSVDGNVAHKGRFIHTGYLWAPDKLKRGGGTLKLSLKLPSKSFTCALSCHNFLELMVQRQHCLQSESVFYFRQKHTQICMEDNYWTRTLKWDSQESFGGKLLWGSCCALKMRAYFQESDLYPATVKLLVQFILFKRVYLFSSPYCATVIVKP